MSQVLVEVIPKTWHILLEWTKSFLLLVSVLDYFQWNQGNFWKPSLSFVQEVFPWFELIKYIDKKKYRPIWLTKWAINLEHIAVQFKAFFLVNSVMKLVVLVSRRVFDISLYNNTRYRKYKRLRALLNDLLKTC